MLPRSCDARHEDAAASPFLEAAAIISDCRSASFLVVGPLATGRAERRAVGEEKAGRCVMGVFF